jgi:hypothetical protein
MNSATPEKSEVTVNLRVPTELLARIDEAVSRRPFRTSRHTWMMEAIYRQLQHETIEGTLDIFWENSEDGAAIPKYRLVFCRYVAFIGGAMQPNGLIGDESLSSHLLSLNFASEQVKVLTKQVKRERSVSIPNVMMPLHHLPQYGYGTSR